MVAGTSGTVHPSTWIWQTTGSSHGPFLQCSTVCWPPQQSSTTTCLLPGVARVVECREEPCLDGLVAACKATPCLVVGRRLPSYKDSHGRGHEPPAPHPPSRVPHHPCLCLRMLLFFARVCFILQMYVSDVYNNVASVSCGYCKVRFRCVWCCICFASVAKCYIRMLHFSFRDFDCLMQHETNLRWVSCSSLMDG